MVHCTVAVNTPSPQKRWEEIFGDHECRKHVIVRLNMPLNYLLLLHVYADRIHFDVFQTTSHTNKMTLFLKLTACFNTAIYSNSSNTYPYLLQCSSTSVTQKTRQSLPVLGSWFDIRMRVPHTRIVLKIRLRRILDMGPVIHTPSESYYIRSHPELGPVLIAFPFANMHESNLDGPERGVLPAVCMTHEVMSHPHHISYGCQW